MKKYGIKYHPKVKEDIKKLDSQQKLKIKTAIERKLSCAPEIYGEKLRGTLGNLWKLRVGDYRIIFLVEGDVVYILGIWHRREAYERVNVKNILNRLNKLR